MQPLQRRARCEVSSQSPHIDAVDPQELIGTPQRILELDLRRVKINDLESVTYRGRFKLKGDGPMRGVAFWFDVAFDPAGLVLDTSPRVAPTHWKQTVVFLPQDIRSQFVDVDIVLSQDDSVQRHYNISVNVERPDENPDDR
mmetsp:Transcript_33342/g.81810  ORF Transcript_33342/g.81810 Transcript_33342/m.81810 type:complete len:142 (-) Transcript_33342:9-434(-)